MVGADGDAVVGAEGAKDGKHFGVATVAIEERDDALDVSLLDHVERLGAVDEHTLEHLEHAGGRLLTRQSTNEAVESIALRKLSAIVAIALDHGGEERVELIVDVVDGLLTHVVEELYGARARLALGLAVLVDGLEHERDHALLVEQVLAVAQRLELVLARLVRLALARLGEELDQILQALEHLLQADALPVARQRIVHVGGRGHVHGAYELGEDAHALAYDKGRACLLLLGAHQREAVVHVALGVQRRTLLLHFAHAALLRLVRLIGEPPAGLHVLHVDKAVAVLEQRRAHVLLLRLGLAVAVARPLVVLARREHERDHVGARLVAMNDAHLAVEHAQVAAGRDVSQAHERVVQHEAAVPARAYELEAPEGARVRAHRARLVEHAVGVLADARLGQSEALVHVAVEEAQHLAAEHVAGVLEPDGARRYRHHCPQRLLKGRVHSMDQALHHIDVLHTSANDI